MRGGSKRDLPTAASAFFVRVEATHYPPNLFAFCANLRTTGGEGGGGGGGKLKFCKVPEDSYDHQVVEYRFARQSNSNFELSFQLTSMSAARRSTRLMGAGASARAPPASCKKFLKINIFTNFCLSFIKLDRKKNL